MRSARLFAAATLCGVLFAWTAPAQHYTYMDYYIKEHAKEWKSVNKTEFKYAWGQTGNRYNLRFDLDPKYYDIFAGLKPGAERVRRIHLTGWWRLRRIPNTQVEPVWDEKTLRWRGGEELAANDVGLKEQFQRPDTDDSQWPWFFVPWDWNRTMGSRSWRYNTAGVGWFRRTFRVGDVPDGYRVILHFEYVDKVSTVWVNGAKIGSYTVYETAPGGNVSRGNSAEHHEYDITQAIKANTDNQITVRVFHNGLHRYKGGSHLRTQTGGIWQPLWVDIVPPVYAERIYVTPRLKDGEIELRCFMRNTLAKSVPRRFSARVSPWQSYRFAPPVKGAPETVAELGKKTIPPGRSQVVLRMKLRDPVTWNHEKPFLYHLQLHAVRPGLLRDGPRALIGQARFGFREITADGPLFRLNGKRLYLPGHQPNEPYRSDMVLAANIEDWCVKYLQSMRDTNILYMRLHSGHYPQPFYDAADEVGLLFCAERLLPVNYDDSPEFAASVKRLIDHSYNHPAIITYSLGNEQYSGEPKSTILKYGAMSTKLYDLYKRWDTTRPITTCSGSGGVCSLKPEEWRLWPKTDYHDNHDYIAGGCQHYVEIAESIRRCARLHNSMNPGATKPYVNGECGYITPVHYDFLDPLAKTLPNLDRALYVKAFREFVADKSRRHMRNKVHNSWLISLVGLGTFVQGPEVVRADAFTGLMEAYRICGMEQVGFNLHSFNPGFTGKAEYMRGPVTAETKRFNRLVRKMMAPLFVTCDDLTRNAFAGRPLTCKTIAINDTMGDLREVAVSVAVMDGAKPVVEKKFTISAFTQERHHRVDTQVALPATLKTGHYKLTLLLKDRNGKTLAQNSHRLHVLGREPLAGDGQALEPLVYFGPKGRDAALGKFLDRQGVRYVEAGDFARLERFKVAIIGPDAFDARANKQVGRLRRFIENGGRLLVLCQSGFTISPVVEGLRYRGFGPPSSTDVVTFEHPAFRGFDRMDFRLWNGRVFPTAIAMTPLAPAVLAATARTYRAMSDMGMSVGEIALGKGVYMFSQMRALEHAENDSVAARYAAQLIRYAVGGEWTTRYAVKVTAGDEKFKRPDPAGVFFVNLRPYCNMGFVDTVADDRKGGWSDQGPAGDMRVMPLGRQTFAGVPFDVIDPAANKGKSCLVLGGSVKTYFPERVDTIAVGRKATHLYFLIAPTYCAPRPGMKIGKLVFHYPWGGFGTTREIFFELEVGKNATDWTKMTDTLPEAAVAFETAHPKWDEMVGALVIPWENPVPEEKIESIDFVSYGKAIPILVAITGTTKVRTGRQGGLTPGHWRLDEGKGKVVRDALGNHPDGAVSGAPEWVPGKFGGALKLGGTTRAVILERPLPTRALGAAPPSFSVSVWIKAEKQQRRGGVGIISTFSERQPPHRGFGLHFRSNNHVYFALDLVESTRTPRPMNDDEWHHLVAVYDGAAQTPSLWVDGQGPTRGRTTDFTPSATPIRLGQYYSTLWDGGYKGLIDEVRIFDKALDKKEVLQLWSAAAP